MAFDSRSSVGMGVRVRRCSLIWEHDLWSSPYVETTNNPSVNAESLGLMIPTISCLLDSRGAEFFITSCEYLQPCSDTKIGISYLIGERMKHIYIDLTYTKREKEIFLNVYSRFSLWAWFLTLILCILCSLWCCFLCHIRIQNLYVFYFFLFYLWKIFFYSTFFVLPCEAPSHLTYSHHSTPGEYLND